MGLQDLGALETEIGIYNELLLNQGCKIKRLLIKFGLNKSQLYNYLDSMLKLGIILKQPKWQAVSPKVILARIESENTKRLKNQQMLSKDIKEWNFLFEKDFNQSSVFVLKGDDHFKAVYEKMVKDSDGCIYTFGNTKGFLSIF